MWVLMLGLASCQDIAEQPAASDTAADEPGYPSLHTVPPRPQLSYPVEQRRAIVDGLVADRENARYSSEVARYRAGLSDVPPPAAPAFAAVPIVPEPAPQDAADAITRPPSARAAPVGNPETEFLDDDDLGTFMEEMVDEQVAPRGPPGRGSGGKPEADAAPPGTRVIRASAVKQVPHAAAYPGRAPVVTLAMPPPTASLPVPVPAETTLAGRAPGVVWGMPEMTPPPDQPDAMSTGTTSRRPRHAPAAAPVETSLAGRAPGVVWGMPDMTPPPDQPDPTQTATSSGGAQHAALAPPSAAIETSLAARAPAVVWGMPDMEPVTTERRLAAPDRASDHGSAAPSPAPVESVLTVAAVDSGRRAHEARHLAPPAPAPSKPAPPSPADTVLAGAAPAQVKVSAMAQREAEPAAATGGLPTHAAPRPAPAKPAALADASPDTLAPSGGPMPRPVPKPAPHGAEIEIADGLIGIDAGRSRPRAGALGSIAFGPQSAMLTPHAMGRLRQLLAEATAHEARIQVVGEAAAPALALDRALAVGLALVQSGLPADRVELTLARGGSSDQAHLFLAAPAL
jgi:hypothetical protein